MNDRAATSFAEAALAPDAPDGWRLQVFNGVHAGAALRLESRPWYLIGSAEDCDVVLRDAGVHPHHLLMSQDGAQWVLRALDAPLTVDGHRLAAGASVSVVDAALCCIQAVSFGLGPISSPAWNELAERGREASQAFTPAESFETQAALPEPDVEGLPADELVPTESTPSDAPPGPAGRRFAGPSRRLAVLSGACLLVVMTGAFGWVVHNHARQAQETKTSIEQILTQLGLREVKVVQGQNGYVRLQGTVPTEVLRSALHQALGEAGLVPALDVVTGERLAAGVQDSFRQKGLTVASRYAGDGKVVVSGVNTSAQAEQVIRDVLAKTPSVLTIEISAPPVTEASARVASASSAAMPGASEAPDSVGSSVGGRDAKRVVGVVGGDPSYVVTQDGARYLTGAVLPNGSQIERIDSPTVTFVRNGNRVQVEF
jgi:type III secretion system YscD/HrpQ family protein